MIPERYAAGDRAKWTPSTAATGRRRSAAELAPRRGRVFGPERVPRRRPVFGAQRPSLRRAHAACSDTSGSRADGRPPASSSASSAAAASLFPELPTATARFRRNPVSFARFMGLPVKSPVSSRSDRRHRSSIRGASNAGRGCHSRRALSPAIWFHGQTSWQMSQP